MAEYRPTLPQWNHLGITLGMHPAHGGRSTAYQNEYGARVEPGLPPWAMPKAGMGRAVGPENSGSFASPSWSAGL